MVIGGVEKLSLIDFPGFISVVIFTKSCNFRCHFCYNPMLVLANGEGEIENKKEEDDSLLLEKNLLLFLKKRIGKIEGVVISGGEPTLQVDLKDFIMKIKKLGFKVKLDTNGTNPDIVEDLIKNNLIDYVAMDIKGPLSKYEEIIGLNIDIEKIKKSIKILMKNKVPYEFRTTLVPDLHKLEDISKMSEEISGAKKWFLQKFKSDINLVNNNFKNKSFFSDSEMNQMLELARKKVKNCQIRE